MFNQQFLLLNLMVQKFALMNNSYLSSNQSIDKIHSSQGTDAGSEDVPKRLMGLCNRSSSISLEDRQEQTRQRQLFAQFLFWRGSYKQRAIFEQMESYYLSSLQNSQLKPIDFTKLSTNQTDLKGKIYDHFIGSWLLHMGYGSSKNRKMFISRIKTLLGPSSINKYAKLYNDFQQLPLNTQEKLDLLIQTCRNGWEYFISQIVKTEQQNIQGQQNQVRDITRHSFPLKSCHSRDMSIVNK